MTCPKKVNYLIRKYDLFIQESTKVTPQWDELTFLECYVGEAVKQIVSPRGRPDSYVLGGGGGPERGRLF